MKNNNRCKNNSMKSCQQSQMMEIFCREMANKGLLNIFVYITKQIGIMKQN